MKKKIGQLLVMVLFLLPSYGADIVLQNGVGGYLGCSDAFISNGTKDVPQGDKNFSDQTKIICDFEHRL